MREIGIDHITSDEEKKIAVEKDWWVVQTLSIIFDMKVGEHLAFKVGTSLSKA